MSHEPGIPLSTPDPVWRTSSYSGGQGDCVEVADNIPTLIPVRDSKRPAGPVIAFTIHAWRTFIAHLS